MRDFLGLIGWCLVVYGPEPCRNPYTAFGCWCLEHSGDWAYRKDRLEIEALRAEQTRRAMPVVSQLVECWDQVPLDARQQITELAPGVVGNVLALQSVMEG